MRLLRWGLAAMGISTVLAQVLVLVSAWQLLGLFQAGTLFTEHAVAPLDRAIVATAAAVVVVVRGTASGPAAQPGLMLLKLSLIGGGLVGILALLVARRVLQQATGMQVELAQVI